MGRSFFPFSLSKRYQGCRLLVRGVLGTDGVMQRRVPDRQRQEA